MNKIRCPGCKGAKQVMKLGGMVGNCNLCKGQGEINECDAPKPPVIVDIGRDCDIVQQVANTQPVVIDELQPPAEVDVKVDGKRAIYKRKTSVK